MTALASGNPAMRLTSVFADFEAKVYAHQYLATIWVEKLAGGIPTDPKVAEAWIRSKVQASDDTIRQMVAETMADRLTTTPAEPDPDNPDAPAATGKPITEMTVDDAITAVATAQHLNGFKRRGGQLFIEGRQAKAMLKEAASVAQNAGALSPANGKKGWGTTSKGLLSWFVEHVFVADSDILLYHESDDGTVPVTDYDLINQRFVHTFRGSGISYEEVILGAVFKMVVKTDYQFTRAQWAQMWVRAQQLGIGATRSQGYGRFVVTGWDRLKS